MRVQPALLGLVDARLGADAGRVADHRRGVRDADLGRLDVRVRERDETGLAAVHVDEHPFRLPGLAIEVDLANSAQPLPA